MKIYLFSGTVTETITKFSRPSASCAPVKTWPEIAMKYRYLGDRLTDPGLAGAICEAIRRADGKCVRGRNGNMLVRFSNGSKVVVVARLLRKIK